jgi:alpha-L-arabinofuranosidase
MKRYQKLVFNCVFNIFLLFFSSHFLFAQFAQEEYVLSPDIVSLEVPFLKSVPVIDGIVEAIPSNYLIPVPNINWDTQQTEISSWLQLGWNEEGLYIGAKFPQADKSKLIRAGSLPETVFTVDIDLDAQLQPDPVGIGKYSLQFIPLLKNGDRMIYRSQPFLMNHRFGAGTDWNDKGAVIWSEKSITGIITEDIQARYNEFDQYSMEVFIPWKNLRVKGLPSSQKVFFNLTVNEPGGKTSSLVSSEYPLLRESEVELTLLKPYETTGLLPEVASPVIYLPSSLHQQSESLNVFVCLPGQGGKLSEMPVRIDIMNIQGEKVVSANLKPVKGVNTSMVSIETAGLKDGKYELKVRTGPRYNTVLASRPVLLAGNIIRNKYVPYHKELSLQLESIKKKKHEAWEAGYLARTDYMLGIADPAGIGSIADLNQSIQLLDESELMIKSLSIGMRPKTGKEAQGAVGGFVADGQKGNIEFVPVEGPKAKLTVFAGNKLDWKLSPLIYGTFSEPVTFDRPNYQLLYAQLLRNPVFIWGHPTVKETIDAYAGRMKEIDPRDAESILNGKWLPIANTNEEEVAAPWIGIGKGNPTFVMDKGEDGYGSQRIELTNGAEAGIAQILSLPAWRCTNYKFEVSLRSSNPGREVRVQLFKEGKPVSQSIIGKLGKDWSEHLLELGVETDEKSQNTYLLSITSSGQGSFSVDRASLYPGDTIAGFDPQVIDQFRALNTGWTRWPGGNYASIYNWRDGIGPVNERRAQPNPTWPGLVTNRMGTDEYIRFSKLTGQEPLICVNAGTGSAEEAANWVEYCNGSSSTEMGNLRLQNGNPEPFGVKYWNIGNELWGNWQWGHPEAMEYADRYMAFSKAMKKKDPDIRLIAEAAAAHTNGRTRWTATLLDVVGKDLDIVDFHMYVSVPNAAEGYSLEESVKMMLAIPVAYEQSLMEFRQECLRRSFSHIKVEIGEFNNGNIAGLNDDERVMVDLLTYAGWIHGFIRQGEYVMGANATEYSVFDPRAGQFGFLHPRNDLFRLYRNEAGSQPLPARIETPVWQSPNKWGKDVDPTFNVPVIDPVVLEDPESGSIGIGLINRDLDTAISMEIDLEDFIPDKNAVHYLMGVGLEEDISKGISSQLMKMEIKADTRFLVTLPPQSVSLIKIFPKK